MAARGWSDGAPAAVDGQGGAVDVGRVVAGEEGHGPAGFLRGGVVMMMSTGDITPLEAALDLGIEYLRAGPATART
jgi:hypothetical protein